MTFDRTMDAGRRRALLNDLHGRGSRPGNAAGTLPAAHKNRRGPRIARAAIAVVLLFAAGPARSAAGDGPAAPDPPRETGGPVRAAEGGGAHDPVRPAAPLTESITGIVRAQSDPFCSGNCGNYFLEDEDGFFLVHLVGSAGSVGIYEGRTIETTGYRAACGGCVSFFITGPVNVIVTSAGDNAPALPWSFEVGPNYPNPFNPSTTVPYTVTRAAEVSVRVFDLLGREAASFRLGQVPPGRHSFTWEAAGLPGGIYYLEVIAEPRGGPPAAIRRPALLLR